MIIRIECPFCNHTHEYFKAYWNMLELILCQRCNREFYSLIKIEEDEIISLSYKTLTNIKGKEWDFVNESNKKKW